MKNAQHFDRQGIANKIGDAIVPKEKNANLSLRLGTIPVSDQGKGLKDLDLLADAVDDALGRLRIVLGDITVDILKPGGRLLGPSLFLP